ncbi:sensor histidine kinase [Rhodopila sp.]|uniref:sensor histidine kinase n=1 Tax=Rhodopila sp. TaxID=2480087 RepID=UPI003D0A6E45
MRLVDLPRTTSFQLALRFLLLFGAASLILFGFLYWQTAVYVRGRVDDWLTREQSVFGPMERDNLLRRLTAHVVADPTLERPFTLFDGSGQRVAGTTLDLPVGMLAAMPQDVAMAFDLARGGQDIKFRGILHRRPAGELLLIARSMEGQRKFAAVLIDAFVWGALFTTLLGLIGAAIVGADSVRRIDAVTRAIRRIVGGDLSERLPTHDRADDLDRLAVVINDMLGELERLMREVKGVCDNIAHDLRTPLTRLLAGLERSRRRNGSTEDYAAAIDEAVQETRGVLNSFAALLRIAEVESGARRTGFLDTDLREVLADVAELYEPAAEQAGVRLRLIADGGAPLVMRGDPSLLFEAVGNLVDNALKFTPRGGCVTLRVVSGTGGIGIEVVDTGPGIPRDEQDAVLRRFYRAEASRQTPGSGLGLALVAAVARLHGMDLAISDARPGCRVTLVRLDASDDGAAVVTQAVALERRLLPTSL